MFFFQLKSVVVKSHSVSSHDNTPKRNHFLQTLGAWPWHIFLKVSTYEKIKIEIFY